MGSLSNRNRKDQLSPKQKWACYAIGLMILAGFTILRLADIRLRFGLTITSAILRILSEVVMMLTVASISALVAEKISERWDELCNKFWGRDIS